MKTFILPFKERRRLQERACRAQQRNHSEVCGVIVVDRGGRIELRFLRNNATAPYRYELKIDDIKAIQKAELLEGQKIIGSFHSHPVGEAVPGPGDLKNGFYKGLEMIYDVCAREVKLWLLRGDRPKELPLIMEAREKPTRKGGFRSTGGGSRHD